jgi:LysR family glycine cleavage system transcriptional activator
MESISDNSAFSPRFSKSILFRSVTNMACVYSMTLRPSALPAFGVFAIAARHQNFAHAAEELGLTASAVSHHVRGLEVALGVKLFQRHARGVALTPEGRSLADAATAALADIDVVATALKSEVRGAARVRIATLHSLTYCWLLPRLPRFTASNPRTKLGFETATAIARFDHTGPDLAIRYGAGYWPGLTATHLMDEYLFPAGSPLLPGIDAATEPAHIPKLPLIADSVFEGWREWFRAAGMRGMRFAETHSFTDSTDAIRAATCGLGVMLARSRIVEPYLTGGDLVRLPGPMVKARFAYYAVHPSHRRLTAPAAGFLEWLRHEAAQETPEPPVFTPAINAREAGAVNTTKVHR